MYTITSFQKLIDANGDNPSPTISVLSAAGKPVGCRKSVIALFYFKYTQFSKRGLRTVVNICTWNAGE